MKGIVHEAVKALVIERHANGWHLLAINQDGKAELITDLNGRAKTFKTANEANKHLGDAIRYPSMVAHESFSQALPDSERQQIKRILESSVFTSKTEGKQ